MNLKSAIFTAALLSGVTPVAAQDELTFFSCAVTGKSEFLESYEAGPVFLFSIAIKGLIPNPGPDVTKQSVTTSMVADRHKLFGGGEVSEALAKEGGFLLNAILPDKRMVSMILVPKSQAREFRLELFGFRPNVVQRWAEMSGRCTVTFSKDGQIPSDFFNALYPLVEKTASEVFSAKTGENGRTPQ